MKIMWTTASGKIKMPLKGNSLNSLYFNSPRGELIYYPMKTKISTNPISINSNRPTFLPTNTQKQSGTGHCKNKCGSGMFFPKGNGLDQLYPGFQNMMSKPSKNSGDGMFFPGMSISEQGGRGTKIHKNLKVKPKFNLNTKSAMKMYGSGLDMY